MENQLIINRIKNSFCNLTRVKVKDNLLEIITPYSTLNNKFVSVFITFTKSKFVINDCGWLHQNYYEAPFLYEHRKITAKIEESYMNSYGIKVAFDSTSTRIYYKTCLSVEEIPSLVFDFAHFVIGTVNSNLIDYKDRRGSFERNRFRRSVDDFLGTNYEENVQFKVGVEGIRGVRFSAVIARNNKYNLINYVTGSNLDVFENDLRKSIVNFELIGRSEINKQVGQRIAVIDNINPAYNPERSGSIMELLADKTTVPPIEWTDRNKILELVM